MLMGFPMSAAHDVDELLESVERRNRSAKRTRIAIGAVGLAVGGVAYLTSIGVAPPEVRDLVASAGTLVVGAVLSRA